MFRFKMDGAVVGLIKKFLGTTFAAIVTVQGSFWLTFSFFSLSISVLLKSAIHLVVLP